MKLSIIILTCNQQAFTERLLRSLDEYMITHEDTETILIDNGSVDNTTTVIAPITGRWGKRYRLISNRMNIGVAAARNQGLKIAHGEYIMILDNDTIVNIKALESLITHLDSNRECGLVAPALRSPNGEIQASAKPYPGIMLKLRHLLHIPDSKQEKKHLELQHPFYVIGACQMFRKSLLPIVGYLDENIFFGPEDADFCMRIKKAGYSIDYLSGISIIHDWQRATRKSPISKLALLHIKALLYFYRKHRRWL